MSTKGALITVCLLAALQSPPAWSESPDNLARSLFSPNEVAGVNLSPQGGRIAILKNVEGRQAVFVRNIGDRTAYRVFDTEIVKTDDTVISGLDWIDERHLIIGIRESRKPPAGLDDARIVRRVLIVSLENTTDGRLTADTYSLRTPGRVVSPLPDQEYVFLFGRSRSVSAVYRIDVRELTKFGVRLGKMDPVDGGQFVSENEVARVNGYVFRWLADGAGRLMGAVALTELDEITLWKRAAPDKAWTELAQWNVSVTEEDAESDDGADVAGEKEVEDDAYYIPIALTGTENVYYAIRQSEDRSGDLFKYNYKTGWKELVHRAPESGILQPLLSSGTQTLLGVSTIEEGRLRFVYFGGTAYKAHEEALGRFPDSTISVADSSLGEDTAVLFVTSPTDPGRFYVYQAGTDQLDHIADVKPRAAGLKDTRTIAGTTRSHDLEIEYFLTLPNDTDKAHALIVMPHGGPIGVMDYLEYDPPVQYFAQSGYAVLQVNYRGSGGYDRQYMEAGKHAFGGEILDDIEAAIDTVVKRDDIDAERICTFGGSYGGYAALMLPVRRPGVYRCAASFAGVTDINLILNSANISGAAREWFKQYIGESRKDYDKLKSVSPVYSVESLDLPLYIAHGLEDRRVDPEHSYRMKLMLDALGRDYRWRIFEDQGHTFDSHEVAAEYFDSVGTFIEQHIGSAGN